MVKTKLAVFLDSLSISSILSIIIILWAKKFIKNAKQFYFFLFLIIFCLFVAILILNLKINKKSIIKNQESKKISDSINYLSNCDKNYYNNFISKLLNAELFSDYFFKIENSYIYINLQYSVSDKDFIEILNEYFKIKNEKTNLYFIVKNKDKSFEQKIANSNFNKNIFSYEIISKFMQNKKIFPDEILVIKKQPFKDRFIFNLKQKTKGLSRRHFKDFLFSGLSLLTLSFIVPIPKFYLIFSTILLSLSVVSIFKKSTINSPNLFEKLTK